MEIPVERCEIRRARPAGRPGRHERLRRLPCPPLDAQRGRARPARRWRTAIAWRCRRARTTMPTASSAKRSMSGAPSCRARCIRTASPAWIATSRIRTSCAPRATRYARAATTPPSSTRRTPPSPRRRQGRRVRHLPHADAELHGDPCPPGSQPAHPASRPLALAGQPERLHPVPHRPEAAWAASAMDNWYGKTWRERPQLRHDPARGRRPRALRALPSLLELAASPSGAGNRPRHRGDPRPALCQPGDAPGGPRHAAGHRPVGAHRRARHGRAGWIRSNRVLSAAPLLSDPCSGCVSRPPTYPRRRA